MVNYQDIFKQISNGKTKISQALRETHQVKSLIYHANGLGTTDALLRIVQYPVVVIAPVVLHGSIESSNPKIIVMSPRLFVSRRPVLEGPILWLYAYAKQGTIISAVLEKKK